MRNLKKTSKCLFGCLLVQAAWGGLSLALHAATPSKEETQFIKNPRQLILAGRRSGEGYFSKDGLRLVFQAERSPENPFFQIFTLDFLSGDISQVSPGIGKTTCSFFHPDGRRILFASTHHDPEALSKQKEALDQRTTGTEGRYAWDYDPTMDLFERTAEGRFLQLTTAEGYDAEGSYSPDGNWIAFCSNRHAFPTQSLSPQDQKRFDIDPSYFGEIYLMQADGSGLKRLTHVDGYDGGPFFSPDGQRIVWRRFDEEGVNADIMTMNLDGGDIQKLTHDFGMAWAPYYHPSQEYLIFTTNREGFSNFELYIVDAKGLHEPVRISYTDGFDGLPVFSPDGQKLVWTSNRYAPQPGSQDKGQLFMANWNHDGAIQALRESPRRISRPAASKAPLTPKSSSEPSSPFKELEAVPGIDPARAELASGAEPRPIPLADPITIEDLQTHVNYLASDQLEGRMTGERGARLAAHYLARVLKQIGVEPISQSKGYLQPFEFQSGMAIDQAATSMVVTQQHPSPTSQSIPLNQSFSPLPFSANGQTEGEIVFAGYGLKVPGEGMEGYDSYQGLNVSNKVVMVLRYVPESAETDRRAILNRYAGLRYKALIAREMGAKALLVVTGPNSPNAGKLIDISSDERQGDSGILAASIDLDLANRLLEPTGKDLKTWQSDLDQENPHGVMGAAMPGQMIALGIQLDRLRKQDQNVIGVIHPPRINRNEASYVLIGAHYDHLGHGEAGGFHIKGEEQAIHNGADDNASGVSLVLEIAAAYRQWITQTAPDARMGLMVGLWSGEELGLIGSQHFAKEPPLSLERIKAYLNFDMVGRLRENKLTLQGVGSSTQWKTLIERHNILAGFQLTLQEDPYLPTDTTAFYPKKIPVLSFFTGSHEDYHRPTDDSHTLNYEGLQRITTMAFHMTRSLTGAEPMALPYALYQSQAASGSRDSLRAYLGTIPNYTAEVEGVPLTGVRAGSPADKAGLRADDVVISLGGQAIANIYDYTYALDAVKIGEETTLGIIRQGQTMQMTITPQARP